MGIAILLQLAFLGGKKRLRFPSKNRQAEDRLEKIKYKKSQSLKFNPVVRLVND